MTIEERKLTIIEELKDKEYRDAFVSEHIDTGLPFQIRALRKQRNWTQAELAKHSGMEHQERISKLENPDNPGFTLNTLKELASGFDVALIVRFVPFSELAEWKINLTSKLLEAESFEHDSYFEEVDIESESKQYTTTSPTNATGVATEEVSGAEFASDIISHSETESTPATTLYLVDEAV